MSWTTRLQKLGLLPAIFRSDLEDAEVEDVLRSAIEHQRASKGALAAAERNQQANGRLREAVQSVRSSAFADVARGHRGIY